MRNVSINVNIDPATIAKKRGLGQSNGAIKLLAETVARLSDPYIPMSSGSSVHMKDNYTIEPDGSAIHYKAPYARFQHGGVVMVGVNSGSPWAKLGEPKKTTGKALTYNGGPMRGAHWEKRMLADRGDEITKAVADYVGGKAK